jgi:hypothetical protein
MHLEVLEKPFCARIKGKTLGPQIATHTLGRFSRNALGRFTKAILCENYQENAGATIAAQTLFELAQSKRTRKSPRWCENVQGKCHRPRPLTTLGTSRRSRNGNGRWTKTILREFTGKMWQTKTAT